MVDRSQWLAPTVQSCSTARRLRADQGVASRRSAPQGANHACSSSGPGRAVEVPRPGRGRRSGAATVRDGVAALDEPLQRRVMSDGLRSLPRSQSRPSSPRSSARPAVLAGGRPGEAFVLAAWWDSRTSTHGGRDGDQCRRRRLAADLSCCRRPGGRAALNEQRSMSGSISRPTPPTLWPGRWDLDGPVAFLPAWETLPFRRTAGRRLGVLCSGWRADPSRVVVAPIGRSSSGSPPRSGRGPDRGCARLRGRAGGPQAGLVAAWLPPASIQVRAPGDRRPGRHHRRLPLRRRPPVRIDLWG